MSEAEPGSQHCTVSLGPLKQWGMLQSPGQVTDSSAGKLGKSESCFLWVTQDGTWENVLLVVRILILESWPCSCFMDWRQCFQFMWDCLMCDSYHRQAAWLVSRRLRDISWAPNSFIGNWYWTQNRVWQKFLEAGFENWVRHLMFFVWFKNSLLRCFIRLCRTDWTYIRHLDVGCHLGTRPRIDIFFGMWTGIGLVGCCGKGNFTFVSSWRANLTAYKTNGSNHI